MTTTGGRDIITAAHLQGMKNKAIVGNVGHFDDEIDMAGLAEVPGVRKVEIKPQVHEWVFDAGTEAERSIIVLSEGRLLNLGNATGHPSFVMSSSFTNQVIAQIELFTKAGTGAYGNGVHVLPRILDEKVARLHLDALGVELTVLEPGPGRVPGARCRRAVQAGNVQVLSSVSPVPGPPPGTGENRCRPADTLGRERRSEPRVGHLSR